MKQNKLLKTVSSIRKNSTFCFCLFCVQYKWNPNKFSRDVITAASSLYENGNVGEVRIVFVPLFRYTSGFVHVLIVTYYLAK